MVFLFAWHYLRMDICLKYKESEDKTMKHNVTITKEENRAIEEYWCIRAVK